VLTFQLSPLKLSVIEAPVSDSAAIDRAAPAARSQLRYETAVVLVRTVKRVLRRRVMAPRIIDKLSNLGDAPGQRKIDGPNAMNRSNRPNGTFDIRWLRGGSIL